MVRPAERAELFRKVWLAALLALWLAGCTRSDVPIPITPEASATRPTAPTPSQPPVTQVVVIPAGSEAGYAVVWVADGQSLAVRQPAGISSVAIDFLASDRRGVTLTGKTTLLGSSQWVEINRPGGGTGWVNGWNLTEQFSGEEFCQDTRVLDLLSSLVQSIAERNGDDLARLASPRRGLLVRHDWWNPEVQFRLGELGGIFGDPVSREWGIIRDSEVTIAGSFNEIILPQWQDVFEAAPEVACNQLGAGSSARPARWPAEYANLNFYSFFRPAPEPGNQLDWRTWGIGIEYVGGEPYVAVLVQFEGEI